MRGLGRGWVRGKSASEKAERRLDTARVKTRGAAEARRRAVVPVVADSVAGIAMTEVAVGRGVVEVAVAVVAYGWWWQKMGQRVLQFCIASRPSFELSPSRVTGKMGMGGTHGSRRLPTP